METILFIAHTDAEGRLPKVALETLTAAQETAKSVSGSLVIGLIGTQSQAAANTIAAAGAAKCLAVTGAPFDAPRYSTDALAIEALIKTSGATVVLAPATSRFSRVVPGATARVGGSIDTKVASLKTDGGTIQASRWFYRQRMLGTFTRTARPWVMLCESGIAAAYQGAAGTATLETIPVEAPATVLRTEVTGRQAPSGGGVQTIRPEADILFVAGAGWTKKQADGQMHVKDAEALIMGFIEKGKASLGSSKSLVDQKSEGQDVITCLSHLNQVGQTGASPRHQKGLATCCHGEEPHVVGWRFINERRAVNLNPNCGWAQGKADVLYVADAFAVMAKVNELLS